MKMLIDPVVVATSDNENIKLMAERADISSGNFNGNSQKIVGDVAIDRIFPLQQWFKFGVWDEIPLDEILA